jgi:hypothetical protein
MCGRDIPGCSKSLHDHLVEHFINTPAGTRLHYINIGDLAYDNWHFKDVKSIVNDHATGNLNSCWCSLARESLPIFTALGDGWYSLNDQLWYSGGGQSEPRVMAR